MVLGRPSLVNVQVETPRHCGLLKEAQRAGMTKAKAVSGTWFRAITVNELQYHGDLLNAKPSKSTAAYLLPEDPNDYEGANVAAMWGLYLGMGSSTSLLET